MTTRPTSDGNSGSRWNARAMLVNGPRATMVMASGAARTWSQITFSAGSRCCRSATGRFDAAQPVGAIEPAALRRRRDVRLGLGGGSEPRPARRVEGLDDGLGIAGGLGRRTVAPHGRDGHHVQPRMEQRPAQGQASSTPGSTSRITFLAILPKKEKYFSRRPELVSVFVDCRGLPARRARGDWAKIAAKGPCPF